MFVAHIVKTILIFDGIYYVLEPKFAKHIRNIIPKLKSMLGMHDTL